MEKVKQYAFSTVLDTSYEDAITKVTNSLKGEGLGLDGDRCEGDPQEET